MTYHLNIIFKENPDRKFNLEEVLSILSNIDLNFEILKTDNSIRVFGTQNLKYLYFKNGRLWSIYESDEKLKILIEYLKPHGFIISGEEGEVYSVVDNNITCSNSNIKRVHKLDLLSFFIRHKIGVLIFLLFLMAGYISR